MKTPTRRLGRPIQFLAVLLVLGGLLFAPVLAGGEDDPWGQPTSGQEMVAPQPSSPGPAAHLPSKLLLWWLTLGVILP